MAKAGEKAKAMPLLREYIEYVGALHYRFRKLIKLREDVWESSLARALAQYKARFPEASTITLGAALKAPNGVVSERQGISQHRLQYRRYLRSKHASAVNFSKRYVKWSV
jgi:hypothetical protein